MLFHSIFMVCKTNPAACCSNDTLNVLAPVHELFFARNFSMRLFYTKLSWNNITYTEFLAPCAKMQLAGEKVLFAAPYTTVSADLASTSPTTPPTLTALCKHMMDMTLKNLETGGGFMIQMKPGDVVWIPGGSIVGEFNIDSEKTECGIFKSLQWIAMTERECQNEFLTSTIESLKSFLAKCCEPSQKQAQDHFKVRALGYTVETKLKKVIC